MALSPMMKQYLEVKQEYDDAILFFRIGDFYEMFYDDAKIASKELDLVLTGKQCGEEERAPMCGVPFHAADVYIGKLVEKGYKVVICEQTEDPALAAGLVKRDVVRVVTPGTVIDEKQLAGGKNNYLCAMLITKENSALCFADVSTGELRATLLPPGESYLINELSVYAPREILVGGAYEGEGGLAAFLTDRLHAVVDREEEEVFEPSAAKEEAMALFGAALENAPLPVVLAVGGLASYLKKTQKIDLGYLKAPVLYDATAYMAIDAASRRNLEITESLRTREKRGTLLWVLDKTHTALGARLLRKWLDMPLIDPNAIAKRQDAVEEFYNDFVLCRKIADLLKPALDLERIMTRVVYGTANAKDLRALASTIAVLPLLKEALAGCHSSPLAALSGDLDPLTDLFDIITGTIVEEPPFSVREGGMIQLGVNEELDRLRSVRDNSKALLDSIERREREATGIKNLKIGFNRVFGYYIEVSKSNLAEVPDRYIRKQTLTGGERFITPELKETEATILGASDRICAMEYEIFRQISSHVADSVRRLQAGADAIALADVYSTLAAVAVNNHYVRPEVDLSDVIDIKEGRHPVVEQITGREAFVPNDTHLDTGYHRLMILTGPNMAGKSTYMRQIALICLLAQTGSFVPAAEARIGIVDKLFTRVGASDDLASGQSTFMLEMSEVAYILKNATARSLIIYDEIGRGTSTFDGMSIAKAVAEYTAGKKIGARTLFATHYHELCELGDRVDGIVNYSIIARKKDKGVVFLRKIVKGAADDSYGIEVAQLAGVPSPVVKRAKEVLAELEAQGGMKRDFRKDAGPDPDTISFGEYLEKEAAEKIRMADVDSMTPLDALVFLSELKKILS